MRFLWPLRFLPERRCKNRYNFFWVEEKETNLSQICQKCRFHLENIGNFAARKRKGKRMTTVALNNLWNYLQGLKLSKKDREWLADKLIEPTADDAKTAKQKAYVKETLTRAFDEVERAKRGEIKMMTLEEIEEELQKEGIL